MTTYTTKLSGVLVLWTVLVWCQPANLGPNSSVFAPPPVNPQPNSIHPPR